jgi:hypothetical protein
VSEPETRVQVLVPENAVTSYSASEEVQIPEDELGVLDRYPPSVEPIYKLLRLGARFRPDWPLEITGVFSEVGEEAEMSSSKCKLAPLSV